MEENMRGRLMNRKGKSAEGRKRAEVPTDIFREKVQELVAEGLRSGRTAHDMWPFVRSRLLNSGVIQEGLCFDYMSEAKAQQATVQKWMRQRLRRRLRNFLGRQCIAVRTSMQESWTFS
jgi:hypothetical protein